MTALPAAITSSSTSSPSTEELVDQRFLRMLPAVEQHANISFRQLSEAEREEAVSEAIASAFCNYVSAARRGKASLVKPGMLATYAVWHVKDGRHIGGSRDRSRDVLSRRAAQHGRFSVRRLHGFDGRVYDCLSQNDHPVWRRILLEDRRTPVPDQVTFRIDWSTFLSRQTDRTRQIVAMLAEGYLRCEVADKFGVTASALTQRMTRLQREWLAFQATPDPATPEDHSHKPTTADRRNQSPPAAAQLVDRVRT